ncbi:MAG: site-2 protease family protein, partial [Rikenellaceae bacterium]
MKLVFTPSTGAYKQIGSVISMGSVFAPVWDWFRFWNMTALFSVILAVMNILPIPALDGGHVMFLIYEVV